MTMSNREILSMNLNYYLKLSGKTQREIAEDLGYSPSTISDWFSGKKYPRINSLQAISDYFGIMKSELVELKIISLENITPINGQTIATNTEAELIRIYRNLSVKDRSHLLLFAYELESAKNE